MELNRLERVFLANQLRILEALYPHEADSLAKKREAVESGYALHYEDAAGTVYHDELTLSADQCTEVIDILDMYSKLHVSYRDLEDKDGIEARKIAFPGFDGNHETTLMSYARYYCYDLERFTELHGGDFNSHYPCLPGYRRMLAEWNASANRHALTKQDIIRILAAG